MTFTTYGSHLHGSTSDFVTRSMRNWGAPKPEPNRAFERRAKSLMVEPEFYLDETDRNIVLGSLISAAAHRGWHLWCAHVRSNHVHALLQPDCPVDRALGYLKARATLALRETHPLRQRFWTKHGSTRYLWKREDIDSAADYTISEQGEPMSVYRSSEP